MLSKRGIVLSLPGAVNGETGFVEGASVISSIHGPNICALKEDKKNRLSVLIENDANCAALAEV